MRIASLAALLASAAFFAPATVQGALKHTDNIVFQQLADLTRPDELKHVKRPFGSIAVNSLDLPKVHQGVDWKVVKSEDADGNAKADGPLANFPGLEPIFHNGKTVNEWAGEALDSLRQTLQHALDGLLSKGANALRHWPRDSTLLERAADGSTFSPILPPSFPLAVRHPYLNVWAPAGQLPSATPPNSVGNGGYLAGQDPAFWTSSYGATGG